MPASPKPLSIREAANYVGVSEKTIRRWIASEHLIAHRVGPRLLRISADSLDRLISDDHLVS